MFHWPTQQLLNIHILLVSHIVSKIVLLKKNSSDQEKLLKFEAEGGEFAKYLRLCTRTIYLKSQNSVQFMKTERFSNLFLEVSRANKSK